MRGKKKNKTKWSHEHAWLKPERDISSFLRGERDKVKSNNLTKVIFSFYQSCSKSFYLGFSNNKNILGLIVN